MLQKVQNEAITSFLTNRLVFNKVNDTTYKHITPQHEKTNTEHNNDDTLRFQHSHITLS